MFPLLDVPPFLLRKRLSLSGGERNVLFLNVDGGGKCVWAGHLAGIDVLDDAASFGIADLDRDGHLDLVLRNPTPAASQVRQPMLRVFRNRGLAGHSSLAVRLRGKISNPDAIGAVAQIWTDRGTQVRRVRSGSGLFSHHTRELHFGLGTAERVRKLEVRWPSGTVDRLENLEPGQSVDLTEGATKVVRK